jgi:hypothetical protein
MDKRKLYGGLLGSFSDDGGVSPCHGSFLNDI